MSERAALWPKKIAGGERGGGGARRDAAAADAVVGKENQLHFNIKDREREREGR